MTGNNNDNDQTVNIIVRHASSETPAKVKLMKMSKGFQWEISLAGDNFDTLIKKIDEANESMKLRYGTVE